LPAIAATSDGPKSNGAEPPGARPVRDEHAASSGLVDALHRPTTMRAPAPAKLRRSHRSLARAAIVVAAACPARALACGASAGGASGVSACSLQEHLESVRPKWRVGASYAFSSTAIRFDDDTRFDETRHVAFATLDYRFKPEWAFEIGVGSIFGGHLRAGAADYEFRPGLLAALGASWRVLDAEGARPFVALTGQLAFALASTRAAGVAEAPSTGYQAADLRIGAVAGWPLLQALTPYALARLFGGPVWWEYQGANLLGGDVHHFQIGAGLLLRLGPIDVFAEGVPLGEQALVGGAGLLL
jgi:hypothetical protein